MNCYRFLLGVLIALTSCKEGGQRINEGVITRATRQKPITKEQWLKQAQEDHEIYGAFDVSKDSIVLIRRSVGLELSPDNGRTWQWIAKDVNGINEFTVDNKGTWWALSRWGGIHEASYCYLYKSFDKGKTWASVAFNTAVFFPYHFYSEPSKPLQITTFFKNEVYILKGGDALHDWKFVKQLADDNTRKDISAGDYFVSLSNNKLYAKRKSGKIDTLMVFPKAYAIYDIKKVNDVIYVTGDPQADGCYFATVTDEKDLKEYVQPGGDANIVVTQFGHIYLTNTEGAFLFKGGRFIHIFK